MTFAHTSPSVCSSGSYLCPYHGAFQARSEGASGGLGPCTGEPRHGLPFRSFLVPYISSILGCSTFRRVALNYYSGSYARIFCDSRTLIGGPTYRSSLSFCLARTVGKQSVNCFRALPQLWSETHLGFGTATRLHSLAPM